MAKNDENPYGSLIGMMRKEGAADNPVPFLIGTVETVAPLAVRVGDIVVEREDLKINSFLLKGYERRWSLAITNAEGETQATSGGGNYEAFSSHTHMQNTIGIPDGTYTTLDDFVVGEELLLLMRQDQQQFIVVCKLK